MSRLSQAFSRAHGVFDTAPPDEQPWGELAPLRPLHETSPDLPPSGLRALSTTVEAAGSARRILRPVETLLHELDDHMVQRFGGERVARLPIVEKLSCAREDHGRIEVRRAWLTRVGRALSDRLLRGRHRSSSVR